MFDGFEEARGNARGAQFLRVELVNERSQQHDARAGDGGVALDFPGEGEAVHARHLHVEDDEVVGETGSGGAAEAVEGGGAVGGAFDAQAPGGQQIMEDVAVGRVVVHHQHAQRGEFLGDGFEDEIGGGLLFLQPGGEPEGRPFGLLRATSRPSFRRVVSRWRDQTCAAELARVELSAWLKASKGRAARSGTDAGVGDGEVEDDLLVGVALDADEDFAFLCEFDGVAEEVGEHLAEPAASPRTSVGTSRWITWASSMPLDWRSASNSTVPTADEVEVGHPKLSLPASIWKSRGCRSGCSAGSRR